MANNVRDLLAEEGAAAEDYELLAELPENVVVSRPNLGRSTVVSVRLSAEEHSKVQQAAGEVNLPVSTVLRLWALDRLRAEEEGAGTSVAERLARLEKAVFRLPA
ncbi:MAG: CopG family transcriptional regulator [Acidimicrobiales bacterium]